MTASETGHKDFLKFKSVLAPVATSLRRFHSHPIYPTVKTKPIPKHSRTRGSFTNMRTRKSKFLLRSDCRDLKGLLD